MADVTVMEKAVAQRGDLVDDVVLLAAGAPTRCPVCGSAAWECWEEIVYEQRVEGVVVGCEVEAGLTCQTCGHDWIEVQP